MLPSRPLCAARPRVGSLGVSMALVATLSFAPAAHAHRKSHAPMDSARAAELYVSDRFSDLPQGNFAKERAARLAAESIYVARSAGVMRFRIVHYKSRADGLEIPAYLFTPPESRGRHGYAAMVWVHGGVHGFWDEKMLPFVIDAVRHHYVIIAPQYRGSGGYGKDFADAIDYGGREVSDVVSAADYLRTLPYVDPARMGIMGWSHGAYITTLALFRHQTDFKAGAAIVPVTNLLFRLSLKGPKYQKSFAAESTIAGLPFEKVQEYLDRSPFYLVDSLETPIMVHVATNDSTVNFVEDEQIIDALRARKPNLAETRVYVDPAPGYTGFGHTFSRRVNLKTLEREDSPAQRDSWNRTWTFFDWYLRPYEDPSIRNVDP